MKTEPLRRKWEKVEKRRGLDARTDHENQFYFIYIYRERFSHRIYIRFSACVSWCCCSSFFATCMHNYLQLLIVFCSFQFYDLASVVSIPQKILHYLVVMFSELSNCGGKLLQNRKLHCKMMKFFQSIFKYGDFKKKTDILWLLFSGGVAAFLPLLLLFSRGEVIILIIN